MSRTGVRAAGLHGQGSQQRSVFLSQTPVLHHIISCVALTIVWITPMMVLMARHTYDGYYRRAIMLSCYIIMISIIIIIIIIECMLLCYVMWGEPSHNGVSTSATTHGSFPIGLVSNWAHF